MEFCVCCTQAGVVPGVGIPHGGHTPRPSTKQMPLEGLSCFTRHPYYMLLLPVTTLGDHRDEKKWPLSPKITAPHFCGPSPLLTCWSSVCCWGAKLRKPRLVFTCSTGFHFLPDRSTGVISETLDPPSAKRIDQLQAAFVHSKLNSVAIP